MNRSFYFYAIFFSGLAIVIALFRSVIYFQLGIRVGEPLSLPNWIIFESLVTLICSLMLLKYYYYKEYGVAFVTLIVSLVAGLFHFIIFYNTLKTKELSLYFFAAILIVMITGIVYGASLIFSKARERPWLKAAGVFVLVLALFSLASAIWAISSVSARANGSIARLEKWVSLIGSLVPLLFIVNFRNERATAKKVSSSDEDSLGTLLGLGALLSIVAALFFGSALAKETVRLLDNPNVGEYAKKIAEPFEARTFVNSRGDTMRYRLMKPLDYDSTEKYPLVVCLHGSSGRGKDNVNQVVTTLPAQLLSASENRIKYPAFLFVPQCPTNADWGGITNIPVVDSLVIETMFSLEEEFSIDENRRYVTGNSMGGYGTWHLICTRPKIFAAAMPICGGGDPALARNIVDIPIWAFHGAKDQNVPVSGSRDIIEAIKNAGGDPKYTEFPDAAHNIVKEVTDTPGLFDWLFAQKRVVNQ
jgi:predicted esterase/flagellar biosynthesis protein FliQ